MTFSLVYLSLCRLFGLVRSARRSESDKDIEIMVLRHQVRILQRQLHARVPYRPAAGPSLLCSAVCCLEAGRDPSWSPPRPSFDDTEKRPSTSGGDGENNEALAARGGQGITQDFCFPRPRSGRRPLPMEEHSAPVIAMPQRR